MISCSGGGATVAVRCRRGVNSSAPRIVRGAARCILAGSSKSVRLDPMALNHILIMTGTIEIGWPGTAANLVEPLKGIFA